MSGASRHRLLPGSQRPLSLFVSRVFKVTQVALSHAPEGLCPSFSLVGDSVVNQVCSELEPGACSL